ncbi:MAG: hypothetical protein EOM68_14045, partial [Spirochaetia bacterium]|nr:hypothetical protein [Spirochaetia bacterium]
MEKFLEEARILARFEGQPNIVSVRDFFQENGTAYMVMTYLEGRTLLKYLDEKGGRISFGEAMETLSPVMDALDEVHAAGLIHRDISPDNIFITHNGQVKLLDFGASKSALNLMQQKSHSVVLKRGYSPPEQYQSRGSLGPWTDVYGMAATLYRAVTGQVPPDSLDRLVEDTLTLDGEMERMLPPLAREGLLLGLSLSPKARPQSMMEFKEKLLGKIRHFTVSEVQRSDTVSLYELGLKYQEGNGVPKDFTKAAELYQKAADLGYAAAQTNLGKMYTNGQGVTTDYDKALEWFHKGAEQGDAHAQNCLGNMYDYGLGVPQDYSKAEEWYRKAAGQGR